MLDALAGRDLAFGPAAAGVGAVVMYDLKGAKGRVGLSLHALEQIILIANNTDHQTG